MEEDNKNTLYIVKTSDLLKVKMKEITCNTNFDPESESFMSRQKFYVDFDKITEDQPNIPIILTPLRNKDGLYLEEPLTKTKINLINISNSPKTEDKTNNRIIGKKRIRNIEVLYEGNFLNNPKYYLNTYKYDYNPLNTIYDNGAISLAVFPYALQDILCLSQDMQKQYLSDYDRLNVALEDIIEKAKEEQKNEINDYVMVSNRPNIARYSNDGKALIKKIKNKYKI